MKLSRLRIHLFFEPFFLNGKLFRNSEVNYLMYFAMLVLLSLFLTYFLYLKPLLFLVLIGSIIILAIVISNIKLFFYLILILLLIIPSEGYAFPPFTIYISLKILYLILSIFVIGYILNMTVNQKQIKRTLFSLSIFFLLTWIGISALIGLENGNDPELIKNDFLVLFLFGVYFFIPSIIDSNKSLSAVLTIIVVCSGIIALEYYTIFLRHFLSGKFIRINPNQGQIFLFSLPLILGTIIAAEISKVKRWTLIILLTICIGAEGVTLTRGLWLSTALSLLLTIILLSRDIDKRVFISALLVIIAGFILVLFYLRYRTGLDIFTFAMLRLKTFFNFSGDITLNQRLICNQIVWNQIIKSPILGNGLGGKFTYTYWGTVFSLFWSDNSYLMLLWKTGIIGTMIFLWIVFKSLIISIKIYNTTPIRQIKIYATAMISFLISWMALAFISPLMIKYLLNVIWATLIALVDSIKFIYHGNSNFNI